MSDVVMPQMGESIVEGTITKWLKKPGDTVAKDEPHPINAPFTLERFTTGRLIDEAAAAAVAH